MGTVRYICLFYSFITKSGRFTATALRQLLRARNSSLPPREIYNTTGVYVPYSFRTAVWVNYVPFQLIRKDEEDKANDLTSLPNDANISNEIRSLITVSMNSPVHPGCWVEPMASHSVDRRSPNCGEF